MGEGCMREINEKYISYTTCDWKSSWKIKNVTVCGLIDR
jgi:hypothetical protein